MNIWINAIGLMLMGIILVLLLGLLTGFLVMLLWNWLMPIIFGLKTITYWQGWGLVVLCNLLLSPARAKNKS